MLRFVKWQEKSRKDVERAFGILVRKFQFLAHPIEYWFIDDIKAQMYGCVLMHNMMVEVRMDRNERDSEKMYALDPKQQEVLEEVMAHSASVKKARTRPVGLAASIKEHMKEMMGLAVPNMNVDSQYDIQLDRWKELYDEDAHSQLQEAVMNQVTQNYITYHEKKDKR